MSLFTFEFSRRHWLKEFGVLFGMMIEDFREIAGRLPSEVRESKEPVIYELSISLQKIDSHVGFKECKGLYNRMFSSKGSPDEFVDKSLLLIDLFYQMCINDASFKRVLAALETVRPRISDTGMNDALESFLKRFREADERAARYWKNPDEFKAAKIRAFSQKRTVKIVPRSLKNDKLHGKFKILVGYETKPFIEAGSDWMLPSLLTRFMLFLGAKTPNEYFDMVAEYFRRHFAYLIDEHPELFTKTQGNKIDVKIMMRVDFYSYEQLDFLRSDMSAKGIKSSSTAFAVGVTKTRKYDLSKGRPVKVGSGISGGDYWRATTYEEYDSSLRYNEIISMGNLLLINMKQHPERSETILSSLYHEIGHLTDSHLINNKSFSDLRLEGLQRFLEFASSKATRELGHLDEDVALHKMLHKSEGFTLPSYLSDNETLLSLFQHPIKSQTDADSLATKDVAAVYTLGEFMCFVIFIAKLQLREDRNFLNLDFFSKEDIYKKIISKEAVFPGPNGRRYLDYAMDVYNQLKRLDDLAFFRLYLDYTNYLLTGKTGRLRFAQGFELSDSKKQFEGFKHYKEQKMKGLFGPIITESFIDTYEKYLESKKLERPFWEIKTRTEATPRERERLPPMRGLKLPK